MKSNWRENDQLLVSAESTEEEVQLEKFQKAHAFSQKAIADFLGVTPPAVFKMVKRGVFKKWKNSNRVAITYKKLDEMKDNRDFGVMVRAIFYRDKEGKPRRHNKRQCVWGGISSFIFALTRYADPIDDIIERRKEDENFDSSLYLACDEIVVATVERQKTSDNKQETEEEKKLREELLESPKRITNILNSIPDTLDTNGIFTGNSDDKELVSQFYRNLKKQGIERIASIEEIAREMSQADDLDRVQKMDAKKIEDYVINMLFEMLIKFSHLTPLYRLRFIDYLQFLQKNSKENSEERMPSKLKKLEKHCFFRTLSPYLDEKKWEAPESELVRKDLRNQHYRRPG